MENPPPEIREMACNLFNDLIDKKTLKKLGTSIEQHMTRDYLKIIEAKFIQLKNEFNSLDYNGDQYLSIDELYNFFASKNPNVNKEEIEYLFELSDKDKNRKISINEFIYIYILLEEKLKMKKESLTGIKESLKSKIQLYENKIQEFENENFNLNGLSNESEVKVHIIELLNLKSSIMSPKCKVVLNLMNKKGDSINEKETQLVNGTSNPKFNEKFSFKVQDINCYIKCNICDSDELINDGYGFFIIEFSNLTDQLTHEVMYDIIGGSNGAKAHVSICFIFNNTKKYKDLISRTSQQIDTISQNIFQIENYIEKLNEPYGLIMCNKINEILEKKILNKSVDVSDYLGSSKISFYTDQRNSKYSYSESPNKLFHSEKEEDITKAKLGYSGLGIIPEEQEGNINSNILRDEVISTEGFLPDLGPLNDYFPKNSSYLGKKSNQLIIIGLLVSILCIIFGKIDILNLILFVLGCTMIYNMFGINERFNTKKFYFYSLIAGIVIDIIWILVLNKDQNTESSLFRVIVFCFTLFSLIIKIILCYLIKNRRRR